MTPKEYTCALTACSRARHEIAEVCNSPIERQLIDALIEWEGLEDGPYLVEARDVAVLTAARRLMGVPVIAPQVPLHGYRIDFLAMIVDSPAVMIAIECDGHQFHERTPEQAEKDRKRDRTLFERGVPTLRFTGREIVRDAFECAENIRGIISLMWGDAAWAAEQQARAS